MIEIGVYLSIRLQENITEGGREATLAPPTTEEGGEGRGQSTIGDSEGILERR